MTCFTGLRLVNFMPYRGTHELELERKIYAVVAEREEDPESNNWIGKSTLAWAFRFLLTGEHPKETEDGIITGDEARGIALEQEGGVEGELEDGVFASRLRKRGQRTELYVLAPNEMVVAGGDEGGSIELRGDRAQEFLNERYGFSPREQEMTWWMQQAEADSLLKIDPAELTRVVGEWFQLGPLERAANYVTVELTSLLVKEREQQAILTTLERERAALCWWRSDEEHAAEVDHCAEWEKQARCRREALRNQAEVSIAVQRDLQDGRRFVDVDAEIVVLKQLIGATVVPSDAEFSALKKAEDEAIAAVGITSQEERAKRQLARGEFDGKCPVGGIDCPVKDRLNADGRESTRLLQVATKAATVARENRDNAQATKAAASEARAADRRRREQLERLEEERLGLIPGAQRALAFAAAGGVPMSEGDPGPTSSELERIEREATKAQARHEQAAARVMAIDEELKLARHNLEQLAHRLIHQRAAAQVLGRNGAQRRIAERMLGKIAASGNKVLGNAGVDLSFALEWSRPTKQPARNCYVCGAAFPKTAKVRECPTCGEPRGKQLDERLRPVPSRVSGAANYLVSIGFRLAAFAWLKKKRSSDWGVAVLDELFGNLDAHNRRALADHLAAMLNIEYGVEQAFVIAHDPGILAGLPGKIRITAGRDGSSIRVG